ncbi:MAG TPA: 3-phosphoshikimate 1-carboxyvinyltransferase [Gaiella sp.]|nr:3-phosphoshikimate 1-carboxyvinyltransferase [Gaiella sp.]HEX5584688.1 3-phosphoshikimate 1-carboxyvinyltransferase [Gaiella sp.]
MIARSPTEDVAVEPVARLVGHVAVPGDKSISHRAVLLGAISEGETHITGFGRSADTEATIAAVRACGVAVEEDGRDGLHVQGVGLRGLTAPNAPIDCRNAGTLVRLFTGILAGQAWQEFELVGDASLSSRPMGRIVDPLRRMGAGIESADGRLPLGVQGRPLHAITYELPVASAQVKSAILLAGLYSDGETTVVEPVPTRDHTERMLEMAGAPVTRRPASVSVRPAERLALPSVEVPGDFSSAAPFVVAATLVPGSELHVHGVNLNPRRTGLLTILERMGARVTVYNRREIGGEPGGDLEVHTAPLVGTNVRRDEVPIAIDELPLFGLAAACARGESVLHGAEELRAKESDRIDATVDALRALGVRARATADGFRVTGVPARLRGGRVSSRGDHRLAMVGAVAGLASREGVRIEDADAVTVSFPGFFELVDGLRRASNVPEDDRR